MQSLTLIKREKMELSALACVFRKRSGINRGEANAIAL